MKLTETASAGHIPEGTRLWLDDKQAAARQHAITEVDPMKGEKAPGKGFTLYTANAQLEFKAGEELAVEGELDRGLQTLFGVEHPAASPAVNAHAHKPSTADRAAAEKAAAIDKAKATLATADDDLTAAQAAFDAAPEAGRADAQQKLTVAQEKRAAAAEALAKAQG